MRGTFRSEGAAKVRPEQAIRRRKHLRKRTLLLCARSGMEIKLPTVWTHGELFDARGILLVRQGERPDESGIRQRIQQHEAGLVRRQRMLEERRSQVWSGYQPERVTYFPSRRFW